MNLTDTPTTDLEAGYVMVRITAARRQMKYLEEGLKKWIASGGKVIAGNHEWGPGANGHRWRKNNG